MKYRNNTLKFFFIEIGLKLWNFFNFQVFFRAKTLKFFSVFFPEKSEKYQKNTENFISVNFSFFRKALKNFFSLSEKISVRRIFPGFMYIIKISFKIQKLLLSLSKCWQITKAFHL